MNIEICERISAHYNSLYMLVKLNIKLFLSLTTHQTMKTYWGSGGIASGIFNLGYCGYN